MNSPKAPCRNVTATSDLTLCFQRADESADHDLNRVYGQIQAVLAPRDRQNLEDAERAWLQYRDKTCAAERDLYEGGTGAFPAYWACLEEETRERTNDLRATYDWKVEKAQQ